MVIVTVLLLATAVPISVLPSNSLTVAPAVTPETRKLRLLELVMLSLLETPLSEPATRSTEVGAGGAKLKVSRCESPLVSVVFGVGVVCRTLTFTCSVPENPGAGVTVSKPDELMVAVPALAPSATVGVP
jgi:hypothetical protein